MIGDRYRAHRDNVIDIYNSYIKFKGNIDDGVDNEFLSNRVESLKNKKFTLAVAGEVKAGKSTFLNALLESEILPSDVLQATSAVVEMFKSDKPHIKIIYESGRQEEISSEEGCIVKIKEKLKKVCAISDEYRSIPTVAIDRLIVENEKIDASKVIEWLQRDKKLEDLNDAKRKLIEKYVQERNKNNIPREIKVGYPLKWKFDELRLVDIPGVNATGGVQDVAYSFLRKADAILFVHPIKPIESQSFRDFVDKVLPERNKETLFLILTHSGFYSEEEQQELYEEAVRLYGNDIDKNRILKVDSILKLLYKKVVNGEQLSEDEDDFLAKYEKRAQRNNRSLDDVLLESSGFKEAEKAIDEFSTKAPNIQLREILEKIKSGYVQIESLWSDEIKRAEIKDPQEFENAICNIQRALDEYENRIHITSEEIRSKHSGSEAQYIRDLKSTEDRHITQIDESNDDTSIRKWFDNFTDSCKACIRNFENQLEAELKGKLKDIDDDFKIKHNVTPISVDIASIINRAKENALRKKDVYKTVDREWDFWDYATVGIARLFRENERRVKTGEKYDYDDEKFLSNLKKDFKLEIHYISEMTERIIKEVVESSLSDFKAKVTKAKDLRYAELEREKRSKSDNEKLIKHTEELGKKKEQISERLERIEEILKDIE